MVWVCLCACGETTEVNANKLRFGVTKSCGCRKGRVATARNKANAKHGHALTRNPSPTYRVWRSAITRCEYPSHRAFKSYGARGISMCSEWREDFRVFLKDMGERPEGYSLDRIDSEGDYEPGNCRWVFALEQAKNTRANVRLTFQGETLILADWAQRLGAAPNALRMRLQRGWSVEKALSTPFKEYKPRANAASPAVKAERKARSDFKHRYRHLTGDLTFDDWQEVLSTYGDKCAYCGCPPETMDHVVPLSRGGKHTKSNVVPACRSCNSSKKDSI